VTSVRQPSLCFPKPCVVAFAVLAGCSADLSKLRAPIRKDAGNLRDLVADLEDSAGRTPDAAGRPEAGSDVDGASSIGFDAPLGSDGSEDSGAEMDDSGDASDSPGADKGGESGAESGGDMVADVAGAGGDDTGIDAPVEDADDNAPDASGMGGIDSAEELDGTIGDGADRPAEGPESGGADATDVSADSQAATGGSSGTGGATGSGGASGQGGTTGAVKLTGTPFGSGPPYGNDARRSFDKAFDGDVTTYVDDSNVSGGYVGIDLGAGIVGSVVEVRYYPRASYAFRMVGGSFQCSTISQTSGYTNLYTIASQPPVAWTQVTIDSSATCRYLRYSAPNTSYTNVAEIEFWGTTQ
jgi:hypothetical protein